jgi:hypothetical protein
MPGTIIYHWKKLSYFWQISRIFAVYPPVGQPLLRKGYNSFIIAVVSLRGFVDEKGMAYDY